MFSGLQTSYKLNRYTKNIILQDRKQQDRNGTKRNK